MTKKITAALLSLIFMLALFIPVAYAQGTSTATQTIKRTIAKIDGKKYISGEVIVQYNEKATTGNKNIILNKFSASEVKDIANGKYTLLRLKNTAAVKQFLQYAKTSANIAYATPNYVYEFPKTKFTHTKSDLKLTGSKLLTGAGAGVDDPMIGKQWFHDTIKLYDAWEKTKGDSSVKVAVIDSGLDLKHPEFAGQVYAAKDFGKIPYVDNKTDDALGHGTHVCGIIAAKANNGIGVAGVAPQCKLIMADISIEIDEYVTFTEEAVIDAIYWSVQKGARIINMSIGTTVYEENPLLKKAIAYAASKNVIVVCAAGNEATNVAMFPSDDTNAVSVIAVNSNEKATYYSNFGKEKDISAPGGISVKTGDAILSTVPLSLSKETATGAAYDYYEGTSMASPVVCGVFALLLSKYPGLTAQQAKDILYATAKDIEESDGFDIYSGYGLVDANAALVKAATLVGTVTGLNADPASPVIGTDSAVQFGFDTDKDGFVTATVKKDGKVIKTLWSNQAKTAGTQALSWDFTDSAGKPVEKLGGYQITIDYATAVSNAYHTCASKTFTVSALALNITGASVSPSSMVQTKGSFEISASMDMRADLHAQVYAGTKLIRELSSGLKDSSASPVKLVWDQKDKSGKYAAAGEYTIKIYGIDHYGRKTDTQTVGVITLMKDDVRPVITDKGGAASFINTSSADYTRSLSLSEPGVITLAVTAADGTKIRTDTVNMNAADTSVAYTWNGRDKQGLVVKEGNYTFTMLAADRIGNVSDKKTFVLAVEDKSALKITASLASAKVTERVHRLQVKYNLSDRAKVYIQIQNAAGEVVKTLVSGDIKYKGNNTASWDLKIGKGKYVKAGDYRVLVSGDNGNGIISAAGVLAFTVNADTKKPTAKFSSKGTTTYTNSGKPMILKFSANERISSASLVILDAGGKTVRTCVLSSQMNAGTEFAFTWDGKDDKGVYLKTGVYRAKLIVKDLAGNQSSAAIRKIKLVDKTLPVITAPKEISYYYYDGTPVNVAFTLSEPAYVTVKVCDFLGGSIFTLYNAKLQQAGQNKFVFSGRDDKKQLIADYLYPLKLKISARDLSGNTAKTQTIIIDIDYKEISVD
jgi:subtilisin family serine protease